MSTSPLIEQFYTAFQNRDAKKMTALYHEDIEFEDPAFGKLQGDRARAMWKMLCGNATDLKINFSVLEVDDNGGKARWEAFYTFSQTGRKVHNIIDATFRFEDGKIITHKDQFNLRRWATQAMGMRGWLLGGTSFFRKKLHAQTNRLLDKFLKRNTD
ncbi:MAG: nuclear transport factor 2 family protein [Saprospiraceae bacterium]|nr:nuclear transport factor 2 family protein [Saprospiraceae bacterium]